MARKDAGPRYALGDDDPHPSHMGADDALLTGLNEIAAANGRPHKRRTRRSRCILAFISLALGTCIVVAMIAFRATFFPAPDTSTPGGPAGLQRAAAIVVADGIFSRPLLVKRLETHMRHIAVPRPVRSKAHTLVRAYLVAQLAALGMKVDEVASEYPDTAIGTQEFINIVAVYPHSNTGGTSRVGKDTPTLALAAHYDTLYARPNFAGAVDSAAPCAMLIEIARGVINEAKKQQSAKNGDAAPTWALQIILFDGEEAFGKWNSTNSLFGSRALAKSMDAAGELERIKLLVVLDLLGGKEPVTVPCNVPGSEHLCLKLLKIEKGLGTQTRHFSRINVASSSSPSASATAPFVPLQRYRVSSHGNVEDDHKPFVERKVPALHIIPIPFPSVWHEDTDNVDAIDFERMADLVNVFSCFSLEFLGHDVRYRDHDVDDSIKARRHTNL